MAERMTREEDWGYAEFVLSDTEEAEKGHLACIDTATGEVVPGAESATLIPVGYFWETKTGDGDARVRVRLFREHKLHWWENDTTSPVDAGDLFSVAYVVDSHTVSADGTGRSIAGRIWGVHATHGVLLEMASDLGLQGPQGEPGV